MLLLIDRGFDGADFLVAVAATKAQFLVRLPALAACPCSSICLMGLHSVIGCVKVRIITANVPYLP